MELKILCHCGNKYKFDVEPVNGQVPAPLYCPNCAANWTEPANAMIARNLEIVEASAPASIEESPPSAIAPTTPPPVRLRVSTEAHAQPVASAPPTVKVVTVPAVASPTAAPRFIPKVPTLDVMKEPEAKGNFALGMVGGFLGAALGMGIWLAIYYGAHFRLKVLALGVGYLAGLGAKLLSKDEGSKELGALAAVFALVAIFSAQYLIAKEQLFGGIKKLSDETYQMQVTYAKDALKKMPNLTDDEIRKFLAREATDEDGDKVQPASVSNEEVKEFREKQLPELQDLASGKMTLTDYRKKLPIEEVEDNGGVKLYLVARGLGLFSITLMVMSAGLAYKVTANA
ncbi:MAG TPA: hypothetical protein VMZ27_02555 [Candidatus Saccharimonadales bacterium]|nr:hypothetical protein [Candidatus Saccharimonadales bacterium]